MTKGWPTRRGSRAIGPEGPWLEDATIWVARDAADGRLLYRWQDEPCPNSGRQVQTRVRNCVGTRNPWGSEQIAVAQAVVPQAAACRQHGRVATGLRCKKTGQNSLACVLYRTFAPQDHHGSRPGLFPSSYLGTWP